MISFEVQLYYWQTSWCSSAFDSIINSRHVTIFTVVIAIYSGNAAFLLIESRCLVCFTSITKLFLISWGLLCLPDMTRYKARVWPVDRGCPRADMGPEGWYAMRYDFFIIYFIIARRDIGDVTITHISTPCKKCISISARVQKMHINIVRREKQVCSQIHLNLS
jgi:hypothetical protein